MRQTVLALPVAALALLGWLPTHAAAQDTKTARGTVTALAADSLTVKVQNTDMTFNVDGKTTVEAAGAGTKTRTAQKAGQPGPKLAEVVKVGQAVEVSYRDVGGKLQAARIRSVVSTATADPTADKVSNGTVKSIAPTSMTITGTSGGATFSQTFTIDATTKVVGKGAGTATAPKGGKAVVTELVGNGDHVSVSYKAMGAALHATEIRVTSKGAPSTK